MPRARALVVADFDMLGGTGVYLKRLLSFLAPRYDVHFAGRPGKPLAEIRDFLDRLGCSYSSDYGAFPRLEGLVSRAFRRLRLSLFYEYLRDSAIRRYLEAKYRPELIVISQGGGCNYFAFLKSRLPLLMITHSLFSHSVRDNFAGSLYVGLYKRFLAKNKAICAVSEAARKLFVRNICSPSLSSIAICIHNYGESVRRDGRRDPGAPIVILTMGHLVTYKNPHVWVAVAKEIIGRYGKSRVRFEWAGAGGMLQSLREEAGPDSGIAFLGFVDAPGRLYEGADIYFQPSILENHSLSVVEAMGCGLPCVVSDAGGLPETIGDGVEGYVCGISQVDRYIEAISLLIEDGTRRLEMGGAARRKFIRDYTREGWEAKMVATLKNLIGAGA